MPSRERPTSPPAPGGAGRLSTTPPGPELRIRLMPDVAAFDFDGTLTDRGSVFGYLSALRGPAAVLVAATALSPRLAYAALAGGSVADRTKELLFERVLAGIDLERAESVGAEFAHRHLDRHLRPSVRQRFDWHRRRGDRVV